MPLKNCGGPDRANRIQVTAFGNLDGIGPLDSLVVQTGWTPTFVGGADFVRREHPAEQPVLLVVLGGGALAAVDRSLLLDALSRARRSAAVLLLVGRPEEADPEIYASCEDFVFWPCSEGELEARLRRFATPAAPRVDAAHAKILDEFAAVNLLGSSKAFLPLLEFIRKVARCDATVLIEGETGVGKENAARAIHYLSDRRESGFIPVNCGAIPDSLVESELFGHEKGAFTDAKMAEPGLVELASRGTLFLDEVNSLSFKAQTALLRFLQTREYRPLGGRKLMHADVRIVAATNADLKRKAAAGEFRGDLLFRLNALSIRVPALRERPDDIAIIARDLLAQYARKYGRAPKTLAPGAFEWLERQPWPGNVRELENVLLRAFLLSDGPVIRLSDEHPGETEASGESRPAAFQKAKEAAINAFEVEYLNRILAITEGNVTAAAQLAGKERRAFGKLLKKYNVHRADYRHSNPRNLGGSSDPA
jgi:DNA-binding NtrC family response regulator